MARKISKKDNRYLARLVTQDRAPCAFCLREVDDEVTYGKLYAIGDIQCHYFCCLLSCCLIQKGSDDEGLFGFMYTDILAELERCQKHKCSYCGGRGANLGCSVGACRKQFHVPCGRDRNAISLYYGSYKSFCQMHAPKQKIPEHIMAKARLRMRVNKIKGKHAAGIKPQSDAEGWDEMVCVICYEEVDGFPTVGTFWPPCCGKDAWFHRTCLQRMALSAGMHYLKCPLCNDKESFYDAVVEQGYYVPDRDAAWELEQNAFAEIYERAATCVADTCLCPRGRAHDADSGEWDIKLCLLCGSAGAHAQCIDQSLLLKRDTLDQSKVTDTSDQSGGKDDITLSMEADGSRINAMPVEQSNISPDEPNSSNTSAEPNISDNSHTNAEISNKYDNTNKSPDDSNKFLDNSNKSPDNSNKSPDNSNKSPDNSNKFDDSNTSPEKFSTIRFVCRSCLPAAPTDLSALASSIDAIIQQEQAQSSTESRRPIMPSRMSIRRTKGRQAILHRPSTSRCIRNGSLESPNVTSSRLELNLRSPRLESRVEGRGASEARTDPLQSPLKMLQQSFYEKMVRRGVRGAVLDGSVLDGSVLDGSVLDSLRKKFTKPRPLRERKRLLNDILDGIIDDLMEGSKQQERVKEWCSPKKRSLDDSEELQYKFSDALEEYQGKENDSSIPNTPTKDHNNGEITDAVSNLRDQDRIDNDREKYSDADKENGDMSLSTLVRDIEDSKTNVPKYEDNNYQIDMTLYNDKEPNLENVASIQDHTEVEQNSVTNIEIRKNSEDIKSVRENGIKTNDVTECCSPTISSDEKSSKTNSLKLLFKIDNENSSRSTSANEIGSKISETPTNKCEKSCETSEKPVPELEDTENSESNDTKKCNTTVNLLNSESENSPINITKKGTSKKSLSLKIRCPKKDKRKSLGGVETTTQSATKNKQKIRPKSESSTDISILKRLLTEKELCSQLLLELTIGNAKNINSDNLNSDTQTNINDCQNNSIKTTSIKPLEEEAKSADEKSKSDFETPKSHKNLRNSQKNLIAETKTTKDLKEKSKSKTEKELDERNSTSTSVESKENSKSKTPIMSASEDETCHIKDCDNPIRTETPDLGTLNLDQSCSTDPPTDLNNKNNLIETPKHKIIEIQQDSSLEISEDNQHINIDVIKIEDSPTTVDSYKKLKMNMCDQLKTCLQFSPIEDTLDNNDVGIDLESFKKKYLSEVDREFKCNFKHKHVENGPDERLYRSPIDFALDVAIKKENDPAKGKKRKLSESGLKLFFDNSVVKKRKMSEGDLKLDYEIPKDKVVDKPMEINEERKNKYRCRKEAKKRRKEKRNKRKLGDKNIKVTIDSSEKSNAKDKKIKKKIKTKFAIQNENIKVKIKWKKEQLSLNIESKKQNKKDKKNHSVYSKFKQYVLQFPEGSSKEVLVKPEKEVCPLKRKYCRNEKSPDNLKQMSIQNFFKTKSEK